MKNSNQCEAQVRFDEFSARAVRVRLGQAAGRQLDSPVLLCVADFSTKNQTFAGYNMAEWTLRFWETQKACFCSESVLDSYAVEFLKKNTVN